MIRGEREARDLARRAVELALDAGATQAEALTLSGESSLTRFANNRIHQNVASADAKISVRAVLGRRIGVASTNRTEEERASMVSTTAESLPTMGSVTRRGR